VRGDAMRLPTDTIPGDCPRCGGSYTLFLLPDGELMCNSVRCGRHRAADAMLERVRAELYRIIDANPPFADAHHAAGVIWEEVEEAFDESSEFTPAHLKLLVAFREVWREVRKRAPDPEAMIEELIQVAAVAIRWASEVAAKGVE